MVEKRAISDTQKLARRQSLLTAALDLFNQSTYDHVSVEAVARHAGVAKGTVYLYFQSKEALFLALYKSELGQWFDRLDEILDGDLENISLQGFIAQLGGSLMERPLLLRLIAILHTVLEHNIDAGTAVDFKMEVVSRVQTTGRKLERFLPFLETGEGAQLLIQINALIIGFQHLAEPSKVVAEALKRPDMEVLQVSMQKHLLQTLASLIMGMAYEAKCRNEKNRQQEAG